LAVVQAFVFTWENIACFSTETFRTCTNAFYIIAYAVTAASFWAFFDLQLAQVAFPPFFAGTTCTSTVTMAGASWIIHDTYLFVAVFTDPTYTTITYRIKTFTMTATVI
jgi:hypothetical protein